MSNSRKIHRYKSEILTQETIDKYGYSPDSLGKTSNKFVVAICRYCGKCHDIRKGFFNKSGSACHKKCKLEEMKQQKSPFSDPEIRQKAEETNLKKYGSRSASSSEQVRNKISNTKNTNEYKENVRKSIQEKYGVDNVFQSEEIKQKIRNTNINKFGVPFPIQNKEIKDKIKQTNIEKYGEENAFNNIEVQQKITETNYAKYGHKYPMQNADIANKARQSIKKTISDNESGYYNQTNILRSQSFWGQIEKGLSLKEVCSNFNLNYQGVTARLLDDEFRDRYYNSYTFPSQQKQKKLCDYIRSLNVNVIVNNRSVISPLELDVYVPEFGFAVEFNGSYWHSEAHLDPIEARKKHINKTNMCKDKGIRLLHIFERDYDLNWERYHNFIKNILHKNTNKIYARKCKITNTECKSFFEKNHLQGYGRRTIKYFNLEYSGEIVASMTASTHHRQTKDNAIVLNRFCSLADNSVVGGASKLFRSFVEWATDEGYSKIISWSDNSWTDGNIYDVLGFELDTNWGVDYFYWDLSKNKYKSKQSQRKSATNCPKELTEREWAHERGLYRIWDCGKKRWSYSL